MYIDGVRVLGCGVRDEVEEGSEGIRSCHRLKVVGNVKGLLRVQLQVTLISAELRPVVRLFMQQF